MKKPSLSIILAVYNEEKYIEKCLSSLFRQTLRPLEIIVVNDESTDNSKFKISHFAEAASFAEVATKAESRDKQNLRLFSQKHQGPALARNLGAKRARGEILVFADADMYFDKRYLENLVRPILQGKAVATFTKEEYVANPENIWAQCWNINSDLAINKRIPDDMPEKAWTFRAIKKEAFLKVGGYSDLGYGEDKSVLEKIGKPLAVVALGALCYHFNPASLSEVFDSARWIGRGEWFKKARLKTILVHSPLNSLRNGIIKSIKHRNLALLLFRFVYDSGIIIGILERSLLGLHVK